MHTTSGRSMPSHCSLYFDQGTTSSRRLSCLKLVTPADVARSAEVVRRFGDASGAMNQVLACTCAPVHDYSGREVARIGVFAHAADETDLASRAPRQAFEVARLVSMRLGTSRPPRLR